MNTKIFGKIVLVEYEVSDCKKEVKGEDGYTKVVFTSIPKIKERSSIKEYKEICSFNGELRYNKEEVIPQGFCFRNSINISQDESVSIDKETFRADLGELHVFTDKVIETVEQGKYEAEAELKRIMREFNKQMIESDESLTCYCKIHKLIPEDTDCIELYKIVHPGKNPRLSNGKLINNTSETYVSSAYKTYSIPYEDIGKIELSGWNTASTSTSTTLKW